MIIHDYYYNDANKVLLVEFSTEEDGDKIYRVLELTYSDVEYYSPELITDDDLMSPDENLLKDIILGYLQENDLPEGLSL